jgi:hypothetical protein
MTDAGTGHSPDQTLEPAMVIAFPAIYLRLESQDTQLLCVEPNAVITRTSTPSNSETWELELETLNAYNSGCAFKYSRALRAICFSPLYASNLGASSSGIHFARATSIRISSEMSSMVPDV